ANGVETQTKKLFEVCAKRKTPILAFINKMDREGRDPFELLDEIEKVLGIRCYPMTWPIGTGPSFRGVYDRQKNRLSIFEKGSDKSRPVPLKKFDLSDEAIDAEIGAEPAQQLRDEIDLLSAG